MGGLHTSMPCLRGSSALGPSTRLHLLLCAAMLATSRKPMQNFQAWSNFGTRDFWQQIKDTPSLAPELVCELVRDLGGVNVSEPTSRDMAASACVALYGIPQCTTISQEVLSDLYRKIKASACVI